MKTINQEQLKTLLANIKGAKPLTISAFVDARPKQKAKFTDQYWLFPNGETKKITMKDIATDFERENPGVKIVAKERIELNPFEEIRKLSKVNGFTGVNYEASVQRQEMREGVAPTFEASERQWGERVSSALVENKGKFYLAIQPKHSAKPVFIARKSLSDFFKVVSKDSIANFLPVHKPNANQGTEKEIIYRNYALESIAGLTIDGETYRVRHA